MTTNVQLNPTRQPNGEQIATDKDTSNQHYQKIKMAYGTDSSFTDVSDSNPYPTKDFIDSIAFGQVSGGDPYHTIGRNSSLGTSAVLISPSGLTQPYFAQTAVQVAVWSSAAADTAAGANMRTMAIEGLLGTSWALGTSTITMAGTSTTTTAESYHRVFHGYGLTAGAIGNSNAGTVTIAGAGTSTFMIMAPGQGETETTHFTVPAGKTYYVRDIHFTADAAKKVNASFWHMSNGTSSNAIKHVVAQYDGLTGSPDFEYKPFLKFQQFTDIWATASTASAGGGIAIEINGVLINN